MSQNPQQITMWLKEFKDDNNRSNNWLSNPEKETVNAYKHEVQGSAFVYYQQEGNISYKIIIPLRRVFKIDIKETMEIENNV